jgi:NAD(P)-dependent dehydrogenase (short-subunit alcohol dehydrogenase family)
VTGASSGIGAESVRVLANAGGRIFALGRDVAKTQAVVDSVAAECGDPERLTVIECDLSDISSVRRAAATFNALQIPLHILLNNAGVMAIPERAVTVDGFEMQFGTNHLGHFVLTNDLIDALKAGAPSRIVNVSSKAHFRNGMNWDDVQFNSGYNDWKVYCEERK